MKKLVLFGDSILGGYEDGRVTNSIAQKIQAAFPTYNVQTQIIPGGTTDDALNAVYPKVTSTHPDLVIMNFGVNDAQVRFGMSAGKYNNNLNNLVENIGPKKVILVSPSYTNWRVADNQSWPRILQFELVTEHVAAKYELPFFDLAKKMQTFDHPNDLLQEDGIHFLPEANELLTDTLIELIKEHANN